MIKKYIIDGNNLIGKDSELSLIQKSDPEQSREKLAFKIDKYFHNKKSQVSLHFDGHPGNGIRTNKSKITYSLSRTADDEIKDEISRESTPHLVAVVSSDHNIQNFARVCSCSVVNSEVFLRRINKSKNNAKSEQAIINSIDNKEMKKLFGV